MKAKGLVVAALVLGGLVSIASRGCFRQTPLAPDERYASHMTSVCDIARDHVKTPEPGVRKLGRYLARHTGDILKDLADTVALIEMIDDDDKHDARAQVTRERWQRVQCSAAWNEFLDAVQQDEDAADLVDQRIARINRTFEIIFPNGRPDFTDAAGLERLLRSAR